MRQEQAPSHTNLVPHSHPGGRDLASVLVVDDNNAAIELARIMLEKRSKLRCNMHYASGAEEALAFMRAAAETGAPVDLLLLDINMPRTDGFEVLAALAADPAIPALAIVMCSTSSFDRDIERAFALGACGYLEKPPQLENLRPVLASLTQLAVEEGDAGVFLLRAA